MDPNSGRVVSIHHSYELDETTRLAEPFSFINHV
jgi:hypothetical protein